MSRVKAILKDPAGESRTMATEAELVAFALMDYKQEVEQKFLEDSHVIQSLQKELQNLHARLDGMGND